jgi:hypothetical protein
MKLYNYDTKFTRWLAQFTEANNIKIPHVKALFTMLIYNTLDTTSLTEVPKDYDTLERIKKTRDSICELFRTKAGDVYDDKNEEFFDLMSPASSGDKGALSDFEGEIHFEPMDVNSSMDNEIIIQGLS